METGQMHEEQQITRRSPFDHGLFFPDSGRSSTLAALRNAVAGPASLITCIGAEGHGKTMLCKIVAKEFSAPYLVILFPYSVESFDYVLQIIGLKLNLDFSTEDNALGSGHLLTEILRTLREQGKRLLILFDEAEKLYLATLERVRKMIDLANEDGILLQIILFGRIGLQTHIEQLTLCTFKNAQEIHLTLPPLTEEDTVQYLNFCMQQRPGSEKKDIFSREVAAKILAVSHGNFRKINTLAGDSLRSSSYNGEDTSFMVLLEHVRDSDDLAAEEPPAHHLPFLFKQKKIALGAGALLIALSLLFFVSREAKNPVPPSRAQRAQVTTQAKTQQAITDKKEPVAKLTQPAPAAATVPVAKPVQPALAAATGPVAKPAQSAPAAAAVPVAEPAQPAPVAAAVPVAKPAQPAPAAAAVPVAKPVQPAPVTATVPVAEPAQPAPAAAAVPVAKPVSVEISPLVEKKSSATQLLIADKFPKKKSIPFLTPESFTKSKELLKIKKGVRSDITQQLPRKSLAAGDKWLAGEKNDHFTLQLMVLAADQAEEKLRGIVRDQEYQKGPKKFIVLKKTTSPATFILFYGEYPTLAAAKSARNNLPQSLQRYTPYPVSIKQAVEKSKQ